MSKQDTLSLLSNISIEDIMAESEPHSTEEQVRCDHDASISSDGQKRTKENNEKKFTILKNYGKLSDRKSAATFALVDWNGYTCYDIRGWNNDYTTPYKGISFTEKEILYLKEALSCYTVSSYEQPVRVIDMGKTRAKIYHVICKMSSSVIHNTKWNKQISIVDWGYGLKYDLRKWTDDYSKCGKGICLNEKEVSKLLFFLNSVV